MSGILSSARLEQLERCDDLHRSIAGRCFARSQSAQSDADALAAEVTRYETKWLQAEQRAQRLEEQNAALLVRLRAKALREVLDGATLLDQCVQAAADPPPRVAAPPLAAWIVPDLACGEWRIRVAGCLLSWHKAAHQRIERFKASVEEQLAEIGHKAASAGLDRGAQLAEMGREYDKSVRGLQGQLLDQREADRLRHQERAELLLAQAVHRNNNAVVEQASESANRAIEGAKWQEFTAREYLKQHSLDQAIPVLSRCINKITGAFAAITGPLTGWPELVRAIPTAVASVGPTAAELRLPRGLDEASGSRIITKCWDTALTPSSVLDQTLPQPVEPEQARRRFDSIAKNVWLSDQELVAAYVDRRERHYIEQQACQAQSVCEPTGAGEVQASNHAHCS